MSTMAVLYHFRIIICTFPASLQLLASLSYADLEVLNDGIWGSCTLGVHEGLHHEQEQEAKLLTLIKDRLPYQGLSADPDTSLHA